MLLKQNYDATIWLYSCLKTQEQVDQVMQTNETWESLKKSNHPVVEALKENTTIPEQPPLAGLPYKWSGITQYSKAWPDRLSYCRPSLAHLSYLGNIPKQPSVFVAISDHPTPIAMDIVTEFSKAAAIMEIPVTLILDGIGKYLAQLILEVGGVVIGILPQGAATATHTAVLQQQIAEKGAVISPVVPTGGAGKESRKLAEVTGAGLSIATVVVETPATESPGYWSTKESVILANKLIVPSVDRKNIVDSIQGAGTAMLIDSTLYSEKVVGTNSRIQTKIYKNEPAADIFVENGTQIVGALHQLFKTDNQ